MLILSRKTKEAILIGDDIEIRVAQIDGDTVKLAIKAPKSVPIHRKELYESVKSSNSQAAHNAGEQKIPTAAIKAAQPLE